jgi:hypothetical protein
LSSWMRWRSCIAGWVTPVIAQSPSWPQSIVQYNAAPIRIADLIMVVPSVSNYYPSQNSIMAVCNALMLEYPRAAAAALSPRYCRTSAETLSP